MVHATIRGSPSSQTRIPNWTPHGVLHANSNLPVLIVGGGYRHASHLSLGGKYDYSLPNLSVSVLQRLGLKTDTLATSTATMRGLEVRHD